MKIVVGLIEHIGDIIACEPVSRYLRTSYPSGNIAWVVLEQNRELIDRNPHIDQTIVVECLTEWMRLIKHCTFDLVVDLHVNYRECPHCRIPLYKTAGNRDVNVYEWFDHGSILQAFSLGAGLPKLSDHPKIYIGEAERSFVDNLHLSDSYSVIHRAPNEGSKDWQDDRWADVIEYLIHDLGLKVVEVGKSRPKEQHEASGELQRKRRDMYIDLVDKTTILGAAEVIRRSSLFLGIDSGPAHMANASWTPGIVLLGRIGTFRRYTPFSGYYATDSEHVKLVRNVTGPAREIPTERVIEAIKQVTAAWREKPPISDRLTYGSGVGVVVHDGNNAKPSWTPPFARAARHVPPASESMDRARKEEKAYPRLFAFHFPHNHPTNEETDAYRMGEGVDWQKITGARPLFRGQYQPKLAGELGFYDRTSLDVIRRQVELAQEYGVTGFCFYLPYYSGKSLFVDTIESYVNSDIEAPFCLVLANGISSGDKKGPRIRQQHVVDDDRTLIKQLLRVLADKRYLKVDGKPVLLVYNPDLFPNVRETTETWRTELETLFDGIYLVMANHGHSEPVDPRDLGFDGCYDFPSNIIPANATIDDRDAFDFFEKFDGKIIDYYKFANFHLSRPWPRYKRFHTVMLPWDDTPQCGNTAMVHVNTENDSYRLWLAQAYAETFKRFRSEERIVFIHSWNDWCNGACLEPDGRKKRRYLEETRDAIDLGKKAIELHEKAAVAVRSASLLVRIDQEKEEGNFRMLEAAIATIRDINRDLAQANAARRQMEEAIAALYRSSSWRLTTPLRTIAGLFGRGARG